MCSNLAFDAPKPHLREEKKKRNVKKMAVERQRKNAQRVPSVLSLGNSRY